MTMRTIAIALKIPDNEAYSALEALRGLGIDAHRLERAQIWMLDDRGDERDFLERVERDESMFNPNKHRLDVLQHRAPRDGEAWIEELDASPAPVRIAQVRSGRRFISWRLYADETTPATAATVQAAVSALLCNAAIERTVIS